MTTNTYDVTKSFEDTNKVNMSCFWPKRVKTSIPYLENIRRVKNAWTAFHWDLKSTVFAQPPRIDGDTRQLRSSHSPVARPGTRLCHAEYVPTVS